MQQAITFKDVCAACGSGAVTRARGARGVMLICCSSCGHKRPVTREIQSVAPRGRDGYVPWNRP